jgi:hypothetical protein
MRQSKIIDSKVIKNVEPVPNPVLNKELIIMIMAFLQLFLCETLAKRIMSLVLIAAGVPDATITESTGQCNRSVRQLRKDVSTGNTKNLFVVNGGGRKSKLADIGQEVIDEIAAGNYYSRQQIVDMIEEKFGIKTSRSAVDRLLKKTASNA